MLKPATNEKGAEYCVPRAMKAVTGKSARTCRLECEKALGIPQPEGINTWVYEMALINMGFKITVKRDLGNLREAMRFVGKKKAILVVSSWPGTMNKHAIAVSDGYVCDTFCPIPVPLDKWMKKSKRQRAPKVHHAVILEGR
jgi:hypothetical protein